MYVYFMQVLLILRNLDQVQAVTEAGLPLIISLREALASFKASLRLLWQTCQL